MARSVGTEAAGAPQEGYNASYGIYGLSQDRASEFNGGPYTSQHQQPGASLLYSTADMGPNVGGIVATEGEASSTTRTSSEQMAALRRAVRERQRLKQAAIQAALMLLAIYSLVRLARMDSGSAGKGKKGEKKGASKAEKKTADAKTKTSPAEGHTAKEQAPKLQAPKQQEVQEQQHVPAPQPAKAHQEGGYGLRNVLGGFLSRKKDN
ncbi:hypothetical protein ACSSS7_006151 [Eimeria intestinalis]